MVPARAVRRGLHIEAVVDAVDEDLGLPLGLHIAAHHAEAQPRYAVLRGEAGDDGLEGPLARRVEVGVSVLEGEELAAILKHEAEPIGHQP